jgi:predicted nucleic acid-binding protein
MKRLKIYLDTSVISYLDQQDAPERMADTHRLWEKIKAGEFDAAISNVTEFEINKYEKSKRKILNAYLDEINYTIVTVDDRTVEIAGPRCSETKEF